MKQQFTYQLDEEKFRRELRDRKMAASETIYRRFCEYSEAHSRPVTTRTLSAMHIKLDRKYMVPAAAAIVVLVLSLALANFTGSAAEKQTTAATSEPFVPMPQTEPEIIIPQPESHDVPAPTETSSQQALQASKPELVREKQPAENKKPDNQLKPVPVAAAPPDDKLVQPVQPTTTQTDTKKPRRNAADILEPVQMPDIRPTLVSPEQEEDIRIN